MNKWLILLIALLNVACESKPEVMPSVAVPPAQTGGVAVSDTQVDVSDTHGAAVSGTHGADVSDTHGAAARPTGTTTAPQPPDEAPAPVEIASDAPPGPDSALVALQTLPADLRITLNRGACYGPCPTYTVTIDGKGNVRFEGTSNVHEYKPRTQKLSKKAVLDLVHRFGEIGFLDVTDEVMSATCQRAHTDASSANVGFTANGRSNTVKDYHGCERSDFRTALRELENAIEKAAVKSSWLKPRRDRPDDPDSDIQRLE